MGKFRMNAQGSWVFVLLNSAVFMRKHLTNTNLLAEQVCSAAYLNKNGAKLSEILQSTARIRIKKFKTTR